MKNHKAKKMLGVLLVTAGLTLSPVRAYSATRCEKMTDDELRKALDQELSALESDHDEEDDAAVENDILSALKNGHLVDYKDLEATMADDGTSVEEVVHQACEEADEADAAKDGPKGQTTSGWTPVSRRGKASLADGATDAVKDLVEKAEEARANQAKPKQYPDQ